MQRILSSKIPGSLSSQIAHVYKNVGGSNLITLSKPFVQGNYIDAYRKQAESISKGLDKPLLKDYYTEMAKDGICAAAAMQWLSTGSIPSPTEEMVRKLYKLQGSFELDSEPNFLNWHSNLSTPFKNLKKFKDSNGLDLNVVETYINYLLDFSGQINKEYKLFLILRFTDNNSHAVGLNLRTNEFFDPNSGVWKISTTNEDAKNIAYSILGLEAIRRQYGNVDTVQAITYTKP